MLLEISEILKMKLILNRMSVVGNILWQFIITVSIFGLGKAVENNIIRCKTRNSK